MTHTLNPRPVRWVARLVCLVVVLAFPAGFAAAQAVGEAEPPNVLLIIADDMGWGDLGCTGTAEIQTPHIDALAADGRLCSQAYVASSVCAPSRAGLITGRHPCRVGFEANLGRWNEDTTPTRREFYGLHPREATLADHMRANGYRTVAVGKWHLGYDEEHYPTNRGFDDFVGMRAGGHSYFLEPGTGSIERNGEPVAAFSSAYITDYFTDEAIRYIGPRNGEEAATDDGGDSGGPWFMYLAYNAPHTPMQATEADLAHYAHIRNEKRRTYCAMMHALDRGVGRIVAHLKQTGQYDNTLIVFFSDNGGARRTNASWNGPLSGSKGNLREGGVRVPMIFTWPDRIPAGEGMYDGVVSALDLLPTMLAACGGEVIPLTDGRGRNEAPRVYDGIDVLPFLVSGEPTPDRTMFWRLQGQTSVLVAGEDKLIRLAHRPAQFFRLATDLGEQDDLAPAHHGRVLELYQLIHDWERSMPTTPHFHTAPYWRGPSANNYEEYTPAPEPR